MITVTVVLWVLGLCWKSIAICYKWHLFFLWKRDTLKCVCTQTLRWLVAVSPCLQWQVMLKRHYGRPAARPSHQCCISDYGPVSSQFSVMLVSGVECWRLHCCGSDGCSPCGGCTCGPGARTRNHMISTAFPVVYLHSQLEKEMCWCSNIKTKAAKTA